MSRSGSGSVEEMAAGRGDEKEVGVDPSAEVKQEIEGDEDCEDVGGLEGVGFGEAEASVEKDDDQVPRGIKELDFKDEDVEQLETTSSLVVTGKRKRRSRIVIQCEESEEECSKKSRKKIKVPVVVPRVKCELCKRKMKSSYLEQHNRKFHMEYFKLEMEKRREERIKIRKARLLNPESTTNEAILAEMEKRRRNCLQRQGITEQEWQSILERKRFQKLEKEIQMTEEERERKRMEGFLRYQSWKAKFTKEEWQVMRRLEHERRKQNLTEEKRKAIQERNKERVKMLSGERLERHKNIFRRGTKKYLDKMRREQPEKYFEKVTEYSRRRYGEVAGKMLDYQRDRIKNESKEQREKRLLRYRVAQAKRKRRREMEVDGRSEEEIEVELKEIEERIRKEPGPEGGGGGPSVYKPRLGARKPHNIKNRKTTLPKHFVGFCGGGDNVENGQENCGGESSTSGLENTSSVEQACSVIPIPIEFGDLTDNLNFDVTCAKVPVIQYVKQIEIEFEGENGEIIPISGDAHHLPIFYDFYEDDGGGNFTEGQLQLQVDHQSTEVNVAQAQAESVIGEAHQFPVPEELLLSQVVTQYQQVCPPPPPQILMHPEPESLQDNPSGGEGQLSDSLSKKAESESEKPMPPLPPPPSSQDIPATSEPEPPELSATSRALRREMCDECGKTFKTKGNLIEHKSLIHLMDPSKLQCPKCSRSCPNTRVLWNHFVRCKVSSDIPKDKQKDEVPSQQVDPLSSSANPKTKGTSSPPKKKVNTNRGNKYPNICDQCGKTFRQKCTLDDHLRRYHQGKGHICPVCHRDLQSASKLWRHQINRHKMKDIPPPTGLQMETCKYCSEVILRGYEQHVQKRHSDKLKEFQEWYSKIKKEKLEKQQKNPQRCNFCNCIYPNKRQLRRHVRHMHLESGGGGGGGIEGTPKEFNRCPDCGKDFKWKNHLKRHLREIHGVEKIELKLEAKKMIKISNRFKSVAICLLCGGKGKDEDGVGVVELPGRNSIRAHFVSEHCEVFEKFEEFDKIKVYSCEICGERFKKEIELREHLERRHEEIEYKCRWCGVFKLSQQQLIIHEKNVHLEERRKRIKKEDGGSKKKPKIGGDTRRRGRGRPKKVKEVDVDMDREKEKLTNKLDNKLIVRLVRLNEDKIKCKTK